MHPNLLQKALDELNKESPKLDYIRGILETVIEISPKPTPLRSIPPTAPLVRVPINAAQIAATIPIVDKPETVLE